MKPLGADYQGSVRQAFEGRWIDVYENPGKRSGAYSAPVYGVHPYMLLNYNDTLDSVFTLAHEMGHSMHTMLSEAHQPFVYSDYTIFVAEVPSTLSEMLFFDHMLARTTDQRERIVLLQHAIDDIVGTFYRQCLFADYELQAHRLAEQGEPITAEALSRVYFDLFKAYHGDSMTYDDSAADHVGAGAAFLRESVLRVSVRHLLCVVRAADTDDHLRQPRRAARRGGAFSRAAARRRQRLSDEPAEACGRGPRHTRTGRSCRRSNSTGASRNSKRKLRGYNEVSPVMALNTLHPIVRDWFAQHFGSATEPQARAWPAIRSGENVLISAPTGSGKTLAAFLICLDELVRARPRRQPARHDAGAVRLAAEGAQQRHPQESRRPVVGHRDARRRARTLLPAIRTAVRTGDTPTSERQQMVKHPPHILVTTPESLFILLTADRSRQALRSVQNGHRRRDSRDGRRQARRAPRASLARLDDLVREGRRSRPQRIGLSATVTPDRDGRAVPRARRATANVTHHRSRPSPRDGSGGRSAAGRAWARRIERDVAGDLRPHHRADQEHRTTLVFVNTRRLAERVAHHLAERLGEDAVLAHHGSLSRKLRLDRRENG